MQRNLFSIEDNDAEAAKSQALEAIENISQKKNVDFSSGVERVVQVIENIATPDLQVELDKLWIDSFRESNKETRKGVLAAIKSASDFALDSKSFETEQRLFNAIEITSDTINLAAPLSDNESSFLKKTVNIMSTYKGDDLEIFSEKLSRQAEIFESRGDETKSTILYIAANAINNQLTAPVLDPRDLVAVNESSIEILPDEDLVDRKSNKNNEPAMFPGATVGTTAPISNLPINTVVSQLTNDIEKAIDRFDEEISSKDRYTQGIKHVIETIEKTDEMRSTAFINYQWKPFDSLMYGLELGHLVVRDYSDDTSSATRLLFSAQYDF